MMDTMYKGSLTKFFSNFYSDFFNENSEEIVMVVIFFCRHYIIAYVYSHSDLK